MDQFTEAQMQNFWTLQDILNKQINPDWKVANLPWWKAISEEAIELRGWTEWKWWKAQTTDCKTSVLDQNLKQMQIEVIDILHFMISMGIIKASFCTFEWAKSELNNGYVKGYELIRKILESDDNLEVQDIKRLKLIDDTIGQIIISAEKFHCEEFFSLGVMMGLLHMTPTTVYETYLGKFALNKFRQDNGYKTKTYDKHWLIPVLSLNFEEDNFFLEKAIRELKTNQYEISVVNIYAQLKAWYGIREGGKPA